MARTVLVLDELGTVEIQTENEGVVTRKTSTLQAVAELFMEVAQKEAPKQERKWILSQLLPPGVLCYRVREDETFAQLFMEWGPGVLPFQFGETLFPAIPYPRLVFKVTLWQKDGRYLIQGISVAAVAEEGMLTAKTPLYQYPYSHVRPGETQMCIGTAPLGPVTELAELYSLPRKLLAVPNSDHGYNPFESNRSGLPLRHLLQNVDGTGVFPVKWLFPLPFTLGEWMASQKY